MFSKLIAYYTFSDKMPLLKFATMMNKAICIFSVYLLFKITSTAYHSYTFIITYNSVQKVTNILLIKPIIII